MSFYTLVPQVPPSPSAENKLPGIVPYPIERRALHMMALWTTMRNNRFSSMHIVWRPEAPQVYLILTFCIQLHAPLHTACYTLCSPHQRCRAW